LSVCLASTLIAGDVPPTEVQIVRDDLHGTVVEDPYRWLEGSDAPEIEGENPERDSKVAAWTEAQNAHTRNILDNLPGRHQLENRIRDLMEIDEIKEPEFRGNRYFTWRRGGGQQQWSIWVQDGLEDEARILLDPDSLDETGLTAVRWIEPSQNGELMAFGLFRAGDEMTSLYILDVATGVWLAEEIPGRAEGVFWLPDASGLFYQRLGDPEDPYSGQIKFHLVGTHHSQDSLLFEQYKEGPLAETWGPGAYVSDDGRWMILSYWTGTDSIDLWAVDLKHWFETGEFVQRDIAVGESAMFAVGVMDYSGTIFGDTFFMFTNLEAPNGRVVAVDLENPGIEHWTEVIPERKDAVVESLHFGKGQLIVKYLKDASNRVERFDLDGQALGDIELPGLGSVTISSLATSQQALMTYESFNEPPTFYTVDLSSGGSNLWMRPDIPAEPSRIEVNQVFYRSKDGTRVPMFLVHKKGLERDGNNPTMLYGYGGFDISMTPYFRATRFPWLESGGIFALANLRGGGEYGQEWHRAGMLDKKQNVFDDFIAAAEWLIDNKYTRTERLSIIGGSNGGLLTGAAVVQRPDLFTAVISAVPLLDMLRYQDFLMARYWVGEYGSAEDPEQFEFIYEYSPYHRVKTEVAYPAVFLTAGENDSRVHPLHAKKMAARLQAATTSDPAKQPILLWVERDVGHGEGMPLDLRVRDATDNEIFLRWQLGMLD
jgi:prolyl oligopeptidase